MFNIVCFSKPICGSEYQGPMWNRLYQDCVRVSLPRGVKQASVLEKVKSMCFHISIVCQAWSRCSKGIVTYQTSTMLKNHYKRCHRQSLAQVRCYAEACPWSNPLPTSAYQNLIHLQIWKKMGAGAALRVLIFTAVQIFVFFLCFIKGFWPFLCNFVHFCQFCTILGIFRPEKMW